MDQVPPQSQVNKNLMDSIENVINAHQELKIKVDTHRLVIDELVKTLHTLNTSNKELHVKTKNVVRTHRVLAVLSVLFITVVSIYLNFA